MLLNNGFFLLISSGKGNCISFFLYNYIWACNIFVDVSGIEIHFGDGTGHALGYLTLVLIISPIDHVTALRS